MPIEIIKYDTVASALRKEKPEPVFNLKKIFFMNSKKIKKIKKK